MSPLCSRLPPRLPDKNYWRIREQQLRTDKQQLRTKKSSLGTKQADRLCCLNMERWHRLWCSPHGVSQQVKPLTNSSSTWARATATPRSCTHVNGCVRMGCCVSAAVRIAFVAVGWIYKAAFPRARILVFQAISMGCCVCAAPSFAGFVSHNDIAHRAWFRARGR